MSGYPGGMVLLAVLGLLATAPLQADAGSVLAITRSGASIEGRTGTAAGATRIDTPFGVFDASHDPVVKVLDPARARHRLRALGAEGAGSSLWLSAATGTGLLQELVAGAEAALQTGPDRLDVYRALEAWGALLDPVPAKLPIGRRPAWLWARTLAATPARSVLYAGRLRTELPSDDNSDRSRSLSIADLAGGLRAREPHLRRAAAQMAAQQREYELLSRLLALSVDDPDGAVREAAAEGASAAHENEARAFWTLVVARGTSGRRHHAAEALGGHGGAQAVDPLILVLASWGHEAGERIEFAGRALQVTRDHDRNLPLGRVGHSAFVDERIDGSSAFKISSLEPADHDALLAALEAWAGAPTGRSPLQWLDWYKNRGKPEAD
ncbi:MAG TPA: hypothetical protein VGC54_00690 [Planctomycetota bacterium]